VLEFDSSIIGGEPPIRATLITVPPGGPRLSVMRHFFLAFDPSVQALALQHSYLYFRHVEPTAVLRGVAPLNACFESIRFFWFKRLIK
jgi:hypothetical protein